MTSGSFKIYRAPGSVAFLSCGSALQPILPKSQAWCVDVESSKFVLQIRRPQYWRIEVPVKEEEEVRLALQLREVFDAILLFEKTPCPFQRPFTVELPELPKTPVKKRPWTPARRSSASLPLTPVTPVEIARLHHGTPRGSFCVSDLRSKKEAAKALSEHARRLAVPEEEETSGEDKPTSSQPIVITQPEARITKPTETSNTPKEVQRNQNQAWLSVPLPPSPPLSNPGSPLLSRLPTTPEIPEASTSQEETRPEAETSQTSKRWSVASSDSNASSEYSVTTAPSSLPDIEVGESSPEPQNTSTTNITAPTQTDETLNSIQQSTRTSTTSTSEQSSSAPSTTLPPTRRPVYRRATTSSSISPSRRALTPLPSAADLFAPRATLLNATSTNENLATSTALVVANRPLYTTVLHKLISSPPAHLISLMLRVASRIAAGEWRGLVLGRGEGGQEVSVHWDWSDDDDIGDDILRRGRRRRRVVWDQPETPTTPSGWQAKEGKNVKDTQSRSGWTFWGDEIDDWWAQRRKEGKGRMAGTFPESDEEDDEVGPMGERRSSKSRSRSNRRGRSGSDGSRGRTRSRANSLLLGLGLSPESDELEKRAEEAAAAATNDHGYAMPGDFEWGVD